MYDKRAYNLVLLKMFNRGKNNMPNFIMIRSLTDEEHTLLKEAAAKEKRPVTSFLLYHGLQIAKGKE